MNTSLLRLAQLLSAVLLLPGCLVLQSGGLEVLNPKHAYGQSVAVVGGLHGENEAIEERLASDLQTALGKRGLEVAADPAKADVVIIPTLGRMRERAASLPAGVDQSPPVEGSEPVEPATAEEPVVAAPAPEARPFHRFSAANVVTRADLISRRAVPSARVPAGAQQAGLLLTGYRGEDFRDYGIARQSLPPVWRIYVSQPAVQMKWKSVAVPLINAAASAAAPLGKSAERGAAGREQEAEEKVKSEEKTESREKEKKDKSRELEARSVEPDEAPIGKRKFLGLFGSSGDKPESVPAGNSHQATGDRSE